MKDDVTTLFIKEKKDRKLYQKINSPLSEYSLLKNRAFWFVVFIILFAAVLAGNAVGL